MVNVLYSDGEHVKLYSFTDAGTASQWEMEVLEIKHKIADVNQSDYLSLEERVRGYNDWLRLVMDMKDWYGGDMVPDDIKKACHDVEHHLGMGLTNFDN